VFIVGRERDARVVADAVVMTDTVTFWVHESALFCLRSAKIWHLSMPNWFTMPKKTSDALSEM
jgi:hypothetical protein